MASYRNSSLPSKWGRPVPSPHHQELAAWETASPGLCPLSFWVFNLHSILISFPSAFQHIPVPSILKKLSMTCPLISAFGEQCPLSAARHWPQPAGKNLPFLLLKSTKTATKPAMTRVTNCSQWGVHAYTVVSNPLWFQGLQPTRLLCSWNSPGKNAGGGC